MPNIKSQIKRVGTSEKERAHNKSVMSSLKTTIKKAEAALGKDTEDAVAAVAGAYSAIDKAASKGVLHKNTANRKKAAVAKKGR